MIIKANESSDESFFPAIAKGQNKSILTKGNKHIQHKIFEVNRIEEIWIYITYDDTQKQASPTETWTMNDGQKLSRSKNTFSEMRVIMPEINRIIHPEGKHP